MKGTLFDDLSRSLALGYSRRQSLKLLAMGVAGITFAPWKSAAAQRSSTASQARGVLLSSAWRHRHRP